MLEHAGVDFREVFGAADLLPDQIDATSGRARLVLTFVVIRCVDEVALVEDVVQIPVPDPHIVSTGDGIVARQGALRHGGPESRNQDFATRVCGLVSLIQEFIPMFGAFECLVVEALCQQELLRADG